MKKLLVLLITTFSLWCSATEQSTIKILIPFSPGGAADKVGRVIERNLSQRLPYNFIVEFQAGGNGMLVTNTLAKTKTKEVVLTVIGPYVVFNSLVSNANYELDRDIVPVAFIGSVQQAIVTNSKSEFTTLNSLITTNKPLFFGGGGYGSGAYLSGELLKSLTGRDMTFTPYKGEAAALNDVLNGTINFTFLTASTVSGFANGSQLNILAVTGTHRHPKMPTVPTMDELGVAGFKQSPNWFMLMTNGSADPAIISQIKTAIQDTLIKDRESFIAAGVDVDLTRLSAGSKILATETVKLTPIFHKMPK